MKKIMMTLFAAMMAAGVSAQGYVGGSIGIASVKNGNADAETTFKFVPEFGYNLSSDWAIGVALGYQKGNCDLLGDSFVANKNYEKFSVSPYVRYTALKTKYVNVFVDGGFDFGSIDDVGTEMNFGLKPGVAVNFNSSLSFVAHIGYIGYKSFNPKADGIDTSNKVGVDLDGNNITFGLYYNF